jgi:hypothetical protein
MVDALDLLRRDAQRRGAVAVDLHLHLRILDLEIAGDVGEQRNLGEPPFELRRLAVQRIEIGALQRVLVEALARAGADVDDRDVLHVGADAGHDRGLGLQLAGDLVGAELPLLLRPEPDEHAAVVHRLRAPAGSHL